MPKYYGPDKEYGTKLGGMTLLLQSCYKRKAEKKGRLLTESEMYSCRKEAQKFADMFYGKEDKEY
jgi:hypothetical protein